MALSTVFRNPLDVGGRMLTFTYLGLLWGLVSYNLPGNADSIYNRMLVRPKAIHL